MSTKSPTNHPLNHPLNQDAVVAYALYEDMLDIGDITVNSLIPNDMTSHARIFAKAHGVVSGTAYIPAIARRMQSVYPSKNPLVVGVVAPDGTAVQDNDTLITLSGSTAHILTAERTMLNFLGHLSGIATATATAVGIAQPYGTVVACTRKTTPLHRTAEKMAVVHGGGDAHRMGLYDAVMIKDNHLLATPDIVEATRIVQQKNPNTKIEVEVDTLQQLKQVLPVCPDVILLDNMDTATIAQALTLRNQIAPIVALEASGSITLDTLESYCQTGVDIVSMGGLTHSTKCLDVSLELL